MLEKQAAERLRDAAEKALVAKLEERMSRASSSDDVVAALRLSLHDFHRTARPRLADRILYRLASIRWWGWAFVAGTVLALLILFGASPARSEIVTLGQFGAWSVHGGTTTRGQRTCALGASVGGGRSILVQYFQGDDALTVRLHSPGWSIPAGAPVQIFMRVGDATFDVEAFGRGNEVRWFIGGDTLRSWEQAFRAGALMQIGFLTGSEAPWIISLAGSGRATSSLASCVRALGSMGGGTPPGWATQPHNPPSAPAPTGRERRT